MVTRSSDAITSLDLLLGHYAPHPSKMLVSFSCYLQGHCAPIQSAIFPLEKEDMFQVLSTWPIHGQTKTLAETGVSLMVDKIFYDKTSPHCRIAKMYYSVLLCAPSIQSGPF
eukprot:scaffold2995_cov130-Cylindrotheca_fusiformis.AAC.8